MISINANVFSDRQTFVDEWRATLERVGFTAEACEPTSWNSRIEKNTVAIFDASWSGYNDSELIAAAGYARAVGATPIVVLPNVGTFGATAGLVDEICAGLVSVGSTNYDRIASVLGRYVDAARSGRFELLTKAPIGNKLLAVVGDGRATLLSRPLHSTDDGSPVRKIELSQDGTTAVVDLESGISISLQATGVSPGIAPDAEGTMDVDGAKLGARLRSLRVQAGLTQAELARRTGIHRPNIARVEAGRHTPSLETLARLAQAIGVPTTRVFHPD